MPRMVGALADWARRTTTSFAELRGETWLRPEPPPAGPALIYRLRQWPSLPPSLQRVDVLRLLSLMSNRPVTRSWMLSRARVTEPQLDRLLQLLERQGAVDVIDPSGFGALPAND
ncbi:MAG TPA: hypothetical protein VEA40_16085 [Ramlibacter sp.]|nr:hypothetical protein [Ramlibacter sp.]